MPESVGMVPVNALFDKSSVLRQSSARHDLDEAFQGNDLCVQGVLQANKAATSTRNTPQTAQRAEGGRDLGAEAVLGEVNSPEGATPATNTQPSSLPGPRLRMQPTRTRVHEIGEGAKLRGDAAAERIPRETQLLQIPQLLVGRRDFADHPVPVHGKLAAWVASQEANA